VRRDQLARHALTGDREQHAHALRRRERQIERRDLRLLPIAKTTRWPPRIVTGHQRVELIRTHPTLKPERPRPGSRPLARCLAAARVVIVAALGNLLLVIALLTNDQLSDRQHLTNPPET
jgi:hypothetical protein